MSWNATARALLAAAVLTLSTAASAGAAAYIKFDGVDGESEDGGIELLSWSTSLGTVKEGRTAAEPFSLAKLADRTSPLLLQAAASGRRIPCATVHIGTGRGDDDVEFHRYTLSDILVSGFQAAGTSGADRPTEQLSLTYSRIALTYVGQDADGSPAEPVTGGWDFLRRSPFEPGSAC